MSTGTLSTNTHIKLIVDTVDAISTKACKIEAAARARGWGVGEGEPAIYSGSSTIDEVLDLRNIAQAGCLSGSLDVCERFLGDVSRRPGFVTCEEVKRFCAELRSIATS